MSAHQIIRFANAILVFLSLILLASCSNQQKSNLNISVTGIHLNCDSTRNENGRILITLNFDNQSSKPIVLKEGDSSALKFLMVSDLLRSKAIALKIRTPQADGQIIKSKTSGKVWLNLEFDGLRRQLISEADRFKPDSAGKVPFSDVRRFLNSNSYSIITLYVSDSKYSYLAAKPDSLKCQCGP